MESAVTAPVSGHVKRVTVHEGTYGVLSRSVPFSRLLILTMPAGDSINQGDLVVEIVH